MTLNTPSARSKQVLGWTAPKIRDPAADRWIGSSSPAASILATAIGPNLLLTGSVATLICRRIARDAGATLSAWRLTAIGAALVLAQLAVAVIGLHLTGALR